MPWIFDVEETAVVVSANVPAPASFQHVLKFTIALGVCSLLPISYWLHAVFYALLKAKREHKGLARQILRELFIFLFMSLVMCICGIVVFHSLSLSWQACAIYGAFYPMFYSLPRIFGYRALVLRASTLTATMPQWYSRLLRILSLVPYSATFGVIPTLYVASGKLLFMEEICTPVIPGIIPLLGALADLCLSSVLLSLFVVPVWKQSLLRKTSWEVSEGEKKALQQAARRNLLWSGISIMSSLLYLTSAAVVNLWLDNDADPDHQHGRLYTSYGGLIDTLVNAATLVWLYQRLIFGRAKRRSARAIKIQPATTTAETETHSINNPAALQAKDQTGAEVVEYIAEPENRAGDLARSETKAQAA